MQERFSFRPEKRLCSVAAFHAGAIARDARPWGFSSGLLAAISLITACWLGFSSAAQAGQQVLKGHVPAITKRLKAIRTLESNRRMDLAIGLPLRNREKLTNLLQDIYQPGSANFRHYLTPDEFAAAFGPTEEDYQAVIQFAKSHGLIVKGTHPNRTLLDVNGSVGDIENAFHVKMRVYKHPTEARTFFAPDTEPTLDLDTPVLAISGLDSYVKPRPQIRVLGGGGSSGGGAGAGSAPGGGYWGYDFLTAYLPDVTLDGAGQSVALFELTGYDPIDITNYIDGTGLPGVPLQNILIDGFDGDDTNTDYAVEATGDIEMALSIAPGLSTVYVYEGPTPLDVAPLATNYIQPAVTTAQINDVFNQIAVDDFANQISCSYEMDINLSTVQIFQQFAAQGQSFFQGSGDFGAYPGAIDQPADDPYITVVGGTTLNTDTNGDWVSETVWLTPASDGSDDGLGSLFGAGSVATPESASGGGVSLAYEIPWWQRGISMSANQGSTTMRNLPDVALVANNIAVTWGDDYEVDGFTLEELLYYAGGAQAFGLSSVGSSLVLPTAGTSLATPLWAGFMALVNQKAAALHQPPIGFANPALYSIAKSASYPVSFHDVTTGTNESPQSPSKYSATAGYDLCTGWGTINTNLIDALLSPPPEDLVVAPPDGFVSFGHQAGPFTVTSQTYILTNVGSTALNWSLVNTSSWLSVSATSGTLPSNGDSTAVTVSLNSAASNFIIGNYSANVVFSNLTDGTFQNRQFDLYVGNGGFETGDFIDWNLMGSTSLAFALGADDGDVAGANALPGASDVQFVRSGLYGAYLGEYDWDGFPPVGTLSQSIATTVGQQYLVSFWLTSVASGGATTPNSFVARWNGSPLYARTNLGAFAWTNLQFVVPATATRTTLEFAFNNTPAAFGLDDVTVEAATAGGLSLQFVNQIGNAITFAWNGSTNETYQVQSASDLSNPIWTNAVATLTTNGSVVTASEPIGQTSQEFYRVLQTPAP
jgi:hypothetical protein